MVSQSFAELRRRLDRPSDLADATWAALCAFALTIPFSIALAQSMLALTTALALRHAWISGRALPRTPLDLPILLFLSAALLAAFLGLDTWQGLWGARTYLQAVIIYLVIAYVDTVERALTLVRFFLAGMFVTSTHTVLDALIPWKLPHPFPGSMSESGQLLFAIGLAASLRLYDAIWPRLLPWALALHVAALIVNLKRGVWLGALAMVVVLGLLRSRRLILGAVAVVGIAVVTVPTVRDRIQNTVRDLYLPGNRYDIWVAAIDVIERFPMGIGRKNGTILRDYPNIPANHKHAHNNFLQITMEFGFLGLAAFTVWMVLFGILSWKAWRQAPRDGPTPAIALAVFASFVGFHFAGLVEYNFGDTEVLEIVFLMMGLGLVVRRQPGNGSESTIVSSRRAPTETILSGTPVSSTSRSR